MLCDDGNCSNETHLQEIGMLYNNIIQVLQLAVEDCVPNIKSHCSQKIPGWDENVADCHSICRTPFTFVSQLVYNNVILLTSVFIFLNNELRF